MGRPSTASQSAFRRDAGGLFRARPLARFPWLVHGFTTRQQGNLNYSVAPDDAAAVQRRRRWLLAKLGRQRATWQLVTLHQVHSDVVQVVERPLARSRREPDGAVKLPGDALLTDQPGWVLAVQVADCLPLLLVDPDHRAVAAVHAGWRGTLSRIAEKSVGEMRRRYRSDPRRLLAAIGPGIGGCCYEVGPEVYDRYLAQFPQAKPLFRRVEPSPSEVHWNPKITERLFKPWPAETRPGGNRYFLDLVAANRQQLEEAGLARRHIFSAPFCTACRTDLFFSHRAERGRIGRQMGVIGIAADR